ncbi:MAG: hypothetical protein V1859_09000 [archaeon]
MTSLTQILSKIGLLDDPSELLARLEQGKAVGQDIKLTIQYSNGRLVFFKDKEENISLKLGDIELVYSPSKLEEGPDAFLEQQLGAHRAYNGIMDKMISSTQKILESEIAKTGDTESLLDILKGNPYALCYAKAAISLNYLFNYGTTFRGAYKRRDELADYAIRANQVIKQALDANIRIYTERLAGITDDGQNREAELLSGLIAEMRGISRKYERLNSLYSNLRGQYKKQLEYLK